jgi:SAM-dependent methyltransferase
LNGVYQNPKYYEIAFSFRDIVGEVDVFEDVIRNYSLIPVSKVFELGCGPAPHLEELARRDYEYLGLDLSPDMLTYAETKAQAIKASAGFHLADMTDFELTEQVDFAFVLLGSLQARNTAELVSHFDSVGRVLKSGGLYLLDWCINFTPNTEESESWEMAKGPVKVKTTYQTKLIHPVEQVTEETLTLDIDHAGERDVIRETWVRREIYPQEFLMFIATRKDFEFIGWWNDWDLTQPLDGAREINRPITVLRRL